MPAPLQSNPNRHTKRKWYRMSISDEEWQIAAASRQHYRAFLLRCWQEKADGTAVWRFTLVQINGVQTRQGFAGLDELMNYLSAELKIGQGPV